MFRNLKIDFFKNWRSRVKGRTVRIRDLGGQREGWLLNVETPRWRMGGGGGGG